MSGVAAAHTPYGDESVAGLLMRRLGDTAPGLRTREETWSWDEVVRESARRSAVARALRPDGPFHIGVLLENVPEFVLWLGGAALAGATVVGINSTRRGEELAAEIRHTACGLIVTDRAGAALLEGLDTGVDADRVLHVDEPSWTGLLERHGDGPDAAPHLSDGVGPATGMLLLLTSGTTGTSKAACCSQGRLAALGRANSAKYSVTRDDTSYCCMPLFHGNALMALWAPSLAAGACVALAPRFSASRFLPDVREMGATFFTYVGKAVGHLLATPARSDDRDNPLTHGFGTEASPEDREAFARRFGAELTEGYGSSEGAGMIRLDPGAPASALGRPAHDGVTVVDADTLAECPPAELDAHGRVLNAEEAVGVLVDKEGAARFEGYWRDPAADAERVRHGWYWTGDLAYRDPEGRLYFAGRAGDWIRTGGENISALHVERILRRHPGVLAAAVYGVPDPRSGDLIMAAVEIADGTRFTDLALPAFLDGQDDLGTKSAPRLVRVSHRLPTTGSGKLRKKQMQLESWQTDDPVYRWEGRGRPGYRHLTDGERAVLREEFHRHGRARFLP